MNTDLRRTLNEILEDPDTIDVICAHCSEGQSLRSLCLIWQVPKGAVLNWIRKDATRSARYDKAHVDCKESAVEVVLDELRALASSDIREIFSSDGSMKPVTDWPPAIARAISSIETDELYEGVGRDREQVGWTKKVRFWDKTKSLELLGKNLGMFIDKTQHDIRVTLEDLVKGSFVPTEKKVSEIPNASAPATLGDVIAHVHSPSPLDSGPVKPVLALPPTVSLEPGESGHEPL